MSSISSDLGRYVAWAEKQAKGLGSLESSYVADAAGADAMRRAAELAGGEDKGNEGLIDAHWANVGDSWKRIADRKRHATANFAESPKARLLNVLDPSQLLTDSPDATFTGLKMVSGKKDPEREERVIDKYKDVIRKFQAKVDMDAEKTTRETPFHLLSQGELADSDMDIAGHKSQRAENKLNYWLNPFDRTGPLTELADRMKRRMGASIAYPDSAWGRFGMGLGNAGTLGLLGLLTGGEKAQQSLRRSATENEIFDEHSMPEKKAFLMAYLGRYVAQRQKQAAIDVKNITPPNTAAAGALLGGGLGALGGAGSALIGGYGKDDEDKPSVINRALLGLIAGGGAGAAGGYLGADALKRKATDMLGLPLSKKHLGKPHSISPRV